MTPNTILALFILGIGVVYVAALSWFIRQDSNRFRQDKNQIAIHESGHAIAAWSCTIVSDIHHITIEKSNGGEVEYAFFILPTAPWCLLVIHLAGLTAEIAKYGKFRSGYCITDLSKSLQCAEEIVENGIQCPWEPPALSRSLPFHKMYVENISLECQQVLLQAYNYCHSLLDTHRHQYKILLAQLKNKKTISSPQEIESVLGNRDLITGLRSVKIGFV